jgi:pimeloyl-ACP methyl ester carboxylesterase
MDEPKREPSARAELGATGSAMLDVGGYRLAVVSSGAGSPTVVLETGLGAESSEWASVQQSVSVARVLRYDRANRASSDAVPGIRTAIDMVEDLDHLLRATRVETPYLLVGHSFGGLLLRLYAHRYHDRVAGLVLVDAMHQNQFDVLAPSFPPAAPSDHPELIKVRSFWQSGWRQSDATAEHIDLITSTQQAREVTSLGDIPLHVIIAGTFLRQPLIEPRFREKLQQRWQALQMDFLKLSTRSTCTLALGSGHFVQRDAPHVVSEAINTMVRNWLTSTEKRIRA